MVETLGPLDIVQIILSIVFIGLLISIFYLLDYKTNKIDRKDQNLIRGIVVSFFVVTVIILLINGLQILPMESLYLGTLLGVPALFLVSIVTILVIISFYLLYYKTNKIDRKKLQLINGLVVSFFVLAVILSILLIVGLQTLILESLHLGTLLGVPALFLVSIGTMLVLNDEPKYVFYHGLLAGSSWILTLINVITLLWITPARVLDFSGTIHTIHVVFGGIGMVTGLLSLLFGISGQRKWAKFTGYITITLWWAAFLLGPFIPTL